MQLLTSYDEFRERLARNPHIVLFEWVEWSKYAKDLGFSILEEAEDRWNVEYPSHLVTWCYGDFSNTSSPMMPVYEWTLNEARKRDIKIANIGSGNGALFWISNGMLLDVSISAYHLGPGAVLQKAAQSFTTPA
jgi:hypothetical protein